MKQLRLRKEMSFKLRLIELWEEQTQALKLELKENYPLAGEHRNSLCQKKSMCNIDDTFFSDHCLDHIARICSLC